MNAVSLAADLEYDSKLKYVIKIKIIGYVCLLGKCN